MAKKKKKNIFCGLSAEDKHTAEKAAKRKVELEMGMRVATHKVHKNKKAYSRKRKHKVEY